MSNRLNNAPRGGKGKSIPIQPKGRNTGAVASTSVTKTGQTRYDTLVKNIYKTKDNINAAKQIHKIYGDWRYYELVKKIKPIIEEFPKYKSHKKFFNLKNKLENITKIKINQGAFNFLNSKYPLTNKIKFILSYYDLTKAIPNKPININKINNYKKRSYRTINKVILQQNINNPGIKNKLPPNNHIGIDHFVINLNSDETKQFLQHMIYDMAHDKLLDKYTDKKGSVINIFKIFIKNYDLLREPDMFNDLKFNISSGTANANSDRESISKIKTNSKDVIVLSKPAGIPFNTYSKLKYKLKKYKFSNNKLRYRSFDIIYDSDTKSGVIKNFIESLFLNELEPNKNRRVVASSWVSCVTKLNAGNKKRPLENLPYYYNSISQNRTCVLKTDNSEFSVKINYPTRNFVKNPHTKIYIKKLNDRYVVYLNDELIPIESKSAAAKKNIPLSKFLGDFLMICKSLSRHGSKKPLAFATQDRRAALIYLFLCKTMKQKPLLIFARKTRLIDELYLRGFDDIFYKNNEVRKHFIGRARYNHNLSATNNNNKTNNNKTNNSELSRMINVSNNNSSSNRNNSNSSRTNSSR